MASVKTKYVRFDVSELLDDDESIQVFLTDILASGDPKVIAGGLGDVARAKGMTELAAKAGLSRENLYRALSEDGNPRLDTLMKVFAALGVTLTVSPADAAE
jgi:probable addiction module antidote protein